jgi:lipoyl(octanoyl) transferase
MSSESLARSGVESVETSRFTMGSEDAHSNGKTKRFLPAFARGLGEASDSARNDKGEDRAQCLFAGLDVYRDISSRSAAVNMAIDEALLESAKKPSIRFYQWAQSALSFGYFGKFEEVSRYLDQCDIVRRWTGGGIVFHGKDLTYSLIIPARHPAFTESSISIYEKIHIAIKNALAATGQNAELAPVAALYERRKQLNSAVADRRNENACFANPVRADVIINGRKVAGAAQRRTRWGLLQQGSIQNVELARDFVASFIDELSSDSFNHDLNHPILECAVALAEQKYATTAWLQRR